MLEPLGAKVKLLREEARRSNKSRFVNTLLALLPSLPSRAKDRLSHSAAAEAPNPEDSRISSGTIFMGFPRAVLHIVHPHFKLGKGTE